MITALFIGQSNVRGAVVANDGPRGYPPYLRFLNNNEDAFGTAYIRPQWGRYPLDRRGNVNQPYANHIALGFARHMWRSERISVYAAVVAKGGHAIECFITPATRAANGWTIRPAMVDVSPYLFDPTQGVMAVNGGPFDVIVKHQGEANFGESGSPDTLEAYQAKEAALIGDLEAAGIKGPDTVYLSGVVWDGHPYYSDHRAAVVRACDTKLRCHRVHSAGLKTVPTSDLHFTGTAISNYGKRFAMAYLGAIE